MIDDTPTFICAEYLPSLFVFHHDTVDALRLMSLIYIFYFLILLCKYMISWLNPCWERRLPNRSDFYVTVSADPIFSKPSNFSFGKKRWESSNLAVLLSSISMNPSKIFVVDSSKGLMSITELATIVQSFFICVMMRIPFSTLRHESIWDWLNPCTNFCTNWNWLDVINTVNF